MSGPPDFDAKYRADPDPWDVGGSPYEQRKRGVVLAGLRRPRYAGAWDPACGTGHLTADLAARCDRVVASDASPTAARLAAERCAGLAVAVSHRALPEAPEDGAFAPDLVLLSEVFYYLSDAERAATVAVVDARAAAGRRGRRRALGRRPGRRLAERARGADRARRPAPRPRLDAAGPPRGRRLPARHPHPWLGVTRRGLALPRSRVIMQR